MKQAINPQNIWTSNLNPVLYTFLSTFLIAVFYIGDPWQGYSKACRLGTREGTAGDHHPLFLMLQEKNKNKRIRTVSELAYPAIAISKRNQIC